MLIAALLIAALQTTPSATATEFTGDKPSVPAIYTFRSGYGLGNIEVEFWSGFTSGGGPEYISRRIIRRGDGGTVVWTSAANCPQLLDSVEGISHLYLGQFNMPNLSRRSSDPRQPFPPPPTPPSDRVPIYKVWGEALQPDGQQSTIQVTATAGLIRDYIVHSERITASCWAK